MTERFISPTYISGTAAERAALTGVIGGSIFYETDTGNNYIWVGNAWGTYGNSNAIVLASAVRAASNNSPDQVNYNAVGLQLVLDITAVPGVQTVLLTLQGKDALSGAYYTILAGVAEVAAATKIYRVYPGVAAVANQAVSDVLPRNWRVAITHSGGSNFTYSVGASLLQ